MGVFFVKVCASYMRSGGGSSNLSEKNRILSGLSVCMSDV